MPLSAEELRVLGCLIEKQFLTPDVYPMTINSIVTACNQKTSRDPVTSYDEDTVDAVLVILQDKRLAQRISGPDHRVPKYRELLGVSTGLRVSELALLCVMMLRGPNTLNELKDRTARIHSFADLDEVEQTLDRLISREPQHLVVKLPRLAGQKEQRYTHLLAGEIDAESLAIAAASNAAPAPPREDRIAKLEAEVADLRNQIANLQEQFANFRKQFE
ncbi:MAG: YceH family protein [Bryobacterales bacterium]|nr:YceH family protein [Bryobacterales bacterium]